MMGICVYWSCRHVVFVKRCNYLFYLTVGLVSAVRTAAGSSFAVQGEKNSNPLDDFLFVSQRFKAYIKEEVLISKLATPDVRFFFVPEGGRYELTSSCGFQEAVVSTLLPFLQNCTKPIIDLGSGSGSFVVLLAEYAKKAVSIIGIEQEEKAVKAAEENLERLYDDIDDLDESIVHTLEGIETKLSFVAGDAFKMEDVEKYGVMHVGFGMNSIYPGFWSALAVGGVLGVPMCEDLIEDGGISRCSAKYLVFQKLDKNQKVPGRDDAIIKMKKDLNFIVVEPS